MDARNALETYCYNMKQTIEDKLGDKLDEDDKEKVGVPVGMSKMPVQAGHAWPRIVRPGTPFLTVYTRRVNPNSLHSLD